MYYSSGRSIAGLVGLSLLGFIGNATPIPMFFGVDQIFGSIFVLIAAWLYGPWGGLASGVAAHSYTIVLWNHPYAFIGFVLEAVVVGYLSNRKKQNLFTADLLFWVFLGVPLAWVFYRYALGLAETQSIIVALKQPANGLFNCLVANLAILFLPVRRWVTGQDVEEKVSFRDMLLTTIMGFVFFSSFITAQMNARTILNQSQAQAMGELRLLGQQARNALAAIVEQERQQQTLGFESAVLKAISSDSCQGVMPLSSAAGGMIRVSVADQQLCSERVMTIGEFSARFFTLLGSHDFHISIYDVDGNPIIVPPHDQAVGSLSQLFEVSQQPIPGMYHKLGSTPEKPLMLQWKLSRVYFPIQYSELSPWTLVIDLPFAPYVDRLQQSYITAFSIMLSVTLGAFFVVSVMRQRLTQDLSQLLGATVKLPERIKSGRELIWPETQIIEIAETANNIREVSTALSDMLEETKAQNQQLMEEVGIRKGVEEQLRKLSSAVEQSSHMIFITDLDGVIEYTNPKFTEFTGYTADEAIGKKPSLLKFGETSEETYNNLWDTILGGGTWQRELKDKRKDGSVFWAAVTITPVRDEANRVSHFVAMHEDITHRKLAEEKIKIAMEKADVANRAKSELLANMSHELRTPLNAIIGFSNTIKEQVFGPMENPKYIEYVGDILDSGEHLLELINDILDVSAIEAGKVQLDEEAVAVSSIVKSSIRLVRPRAHKGQVSLNHGPLEGLPDITVDERRCKQVLINLLSNAVKFTPEGGAVTVVAEPTDDGRLVISVADTGVGMDAGELDKAMTQFGQADSGLNRKHEGSGLGLPLSKGLVELHGGEFNIHSIKGEGTTVSITLPAKRVAAS